MEKIDSEINRYLSELNEEELNEIMTEEELLEMRKKLNPYGRVIKGSNNVLVFSYTDLRKKYLEKLLMTTFIGFLNRACDEWGLPDGLVATPVYDYVKDPSCIDLDPEKKYTEEFLEDHKANLEMMPKRIIVKEFLEQCFQFDPDIHVQSGYKPNPLDPQRKEIINTPAGKLAVASHTSKDLELKERMLTPLKMINPDEKSEIFTMIPPDEIFYKINRYYEANYEALRDAVRLLYCEKPDIETAIMPYTMVNSFDEADEYIKKHKDEVIAPMYKVQSGTWGMIGPFKDVMESVQYYNKNTQVLEELMKKRESDEKMGAELMKKRIKTKKKEKIKKYGPDDPAFTKWRKQNKALEAYNLTEESETPENAVEVDVFRLSHGGHKTKKDKLYTEAQPLNIS